MSNLIAKNITSSSIAVSGYRVSSIDSTDVEVVIVENTFSHDRRNAFKYTDNGSSYWYVIGINHVGWVTDLSAIGYEEYSPAPVLPTVTVGNTAYCYDSSSSTLNLSPNGSFYGHDSSGNDLQYDSSLGYAVYSMFASKTGASEYYCVYFSASNDADKIKITNISSLSVQVHRVMYATCPDSTATVVTVYNSSNVAYNAFKFTLSGTDYYYVLDGTQTNWTDDLAGIGYSEIPVVVLPTVSVTGDFGSYNWLYSQPGQTTYENVSAGNFSDVYYSGATVTYDSAKCYAIQKWFTTEATSGYEGVNGVFSVINDNGSIALKNESSAEKSIFSARCAVCSSNQATVVTVYDSSNVAYNSFKFIMSGTDYYYVLDGVQTNWTDDLSSIGYSRSIEVWFYLDRASASKTFDADDYWGTFIIDDTDRQILSNYGVTIYHTTYAQNEYQVDKTSIDNFSFEPLGLYSGVRTGDLGADMNNFYCSTHTGGIYRSVVIKSINAYSTPAKTWKCRITKL